MFHVIEQKILFLLLFFLDETFDAGKSVVFFGLDGVESVLLGLLVLETASTVFLTKGFELELLNAAKVLFLVDYKTKVLIIFIGWSSRWFQPFY